MVIVEFVFVYFCRCVSYDELVFLNSYTNVYNRREKSLLVKVIVLNGE